jgi:predicted DNA-binding transcriptional regulator AlpA
MDREALSIAEFCEAHGISRSHYFNLKKVDHGPREMRVGSRVLISREAAADWRRAREADAAEANAA